MHAVLEPVNRLRHATEQRIREVDVVTTAFRSVLAREMDYVSTPITSGGRLYEALRRHGVALQEFMANKAALVEEVITPNIEEATAVSHALLEKDGGTIISPAIFEANAIRWGQDEYMALWLRVINEKVTRIVLLDGWEYSNGAVEEFCEAVLMRAGYRGRTNIRIARRDGSELPLDDAVQGILHAVNDLAAQRYAPRVLAETLHRILYAVDEGRLTIDKRLATEADFFLYDNIALLTEVDPAFVRKVGLGRLWAERQGRPMDAHLLRSRESLPESVRLRVLECDGGSAT